MKEKNVLITGGTKGLGKAIVIEFLLNGYNVVANYHSDDLGANQLKEIAKDYHGDLSVIKADVGNFAEMEILCEQALNRYGSIDIFIHNAVNVQRYDLLSITNEIWQKALDTNLTPLLIGARKLVPGMKKKKWGRIFAISSLGSEMAVEGYATVGVAKAGMESLIRYMAAEFGPYGITANTISPGTLNTESARRANPNFEKRLAKVRETIPSYRPMEMEDVAKVIVQLSQNNMEMINGETIRVDGGQRIKAIVDGS